MKAGLPFKYIVCAKNGKQYVIFDFKDDNGKRKRKWVGTGLPESCSKRALSAAVDKVISEFYKEFLTGSLTKVQTPKVDKSVMSETILSNGASTNANSYGFMDFMYYWLETVKPTIAHNTYVGYLRHLKKIAEYFNANYEGLRLGEVTGLHLQQFYNHKYNNGLTGNTVKHYHANIHKALKYAVKMDLIPSNPADKVDLPKVEKYRANFYTKKELDLLFDAFVGDRMELVVHIAAYYGLRRSEIIGLKWDAIDFEKKTITVCRKVTSINGNGTGHEEITVDDELKTEASVRTFPLIPHIEKLLRERLVLETHYSKILKGDFDREYDGFVCRDNFGKLITPDFVSRHFKYIVKKNNLKPIRFHDLRHSCASLLLANGVPMKAIQEWLGHSTFNVTANFYSHLDYSSKISSADTISRVLSGTDTEQADDTNEGKPKK